jgi:uncharacterized damage-inducible protein DinB
MRLRIVAVGLVLCTVMASGRPGAQAAAPTGAMMEPSKALDVMLSEYERELMGAAKAMPADKYDFAPSPAIFAPGEKPDFATVRTFAQQIAHLAGANYFFFKAVSGEKPGVDTKAIGSMTKKEDLVAALAASFEYAHRAVRTITTANAFEKIEGVDGMETRVTVAGFGVAHGFDHYGQIVEYLRMNGLKPPASM